MKSAMESMIGSPLYSPIPAPRQPEDYPYADNPEERTEERTVVPKKSILDYESESRIGAGSFGVVFLSRHKETGRLYAIKECYKHKVKKMDCTHQVMRERRAMARLDHGFVVKLHASFQDRFAIYFVLEYAPNGTLLEKFEEYGVFRNDVTRFYTAEIIMALEYLRKQKIVHRDLKMENVLLDKDFHIKVTDFGYSIVLEAHFEEGSRRNVAKAAQKTNTEYIGTDGYLAPEVIDKGPVTFGTDLWCLGCMLYEFHTGAMAFDQGEENWKFVRTGRYRIFPDGSDPAVQDLVAKLLIPDPMERIGVDDFSWLKNHQFYGTEDIEDWDVIHTLVPPPFDPEVAADPNYDVIYSSGVFGASDEEKVYAGASEPETVPPPRVMDWDDMVTPVPISPPPGPIPVPPPSGKCKCCSIQ